jgi:hypothetical protein
LLLFKGLEIFAQAYIFSLFKKSNRNIFFITHLCQVNKKLIYASLSPSPSPSLSPSLFISPSLSLSLSLSLSINSLILI